MRQLLFVTVHVVFVWHWLALASGISHYQLAISTTLACHQSSLGGRNRYATTAGRIHQLRTSTAMEDYETVVDGILKWTEA